MSKDRTYAGLFRAMESLIDACVQNSDLLEGVEPLRDDLQDRLIELRTLKNDQENLIGLRLAATQKVEERADRARDSLRALRKFVQIRLGLRSKHLIQFGVKPLVPRPHKDSTSEEPEPPPQGKVEAPQKPAEP